MFRILNILELQTPVFQFSPLPDCRLYYNIYNIRRHRSRFGVCLAIMTGMYRVMKNDMNHEGGIMLFGVFGWKYKEGAKDVYTL